MDANNSASTKTTKSSLKVPGLRFLRRSSSKKSAASNSEDRKIFKSVASIFRSLSVDRSRSTRKAKEKDEQIPSTVTLSMLLTTPERYQVLELDDTEDQEPTVVRHKRFATLDSSEKPFTQPWEAELFSVKADKIGNNYCTDKQTKASLAQEGKFHQLRVMHNRLLQWRFANAKAEVTFAGVKAKAEGKLLGLGLKLYQLRYNIARKNMKLERVKQKIRLLEIVTPQLELLKEWEELENKLEKTNSEAVGSITSRQLAFAYKIPLVDGAKADIASVSDTMNLAMDLMTNIEEVIKSYHIQAEKTSDLLRELVDTVAQSRKCFDELEVEMKTSMPLADCLLQRNKLIGEDPLGRSLVLSSAESTSAIQVSALPSSDETPAAQPSALSEVNQSEKQMVSLSSEQDIDSSQSTTTISQWLWNITKRSHHAAVASSGKMFLGCFFFLSSYILGRKQNAIRRVVNRGALSWKKIVKYLWQLLFSRRMNRLAAVKLIPASAARRR